MKSKRTYSFHAERLPALDADQLIEDYRHLIKLTNPEIVPYPDKDLIRLNRHLIRHAADVPVLLSAMASKPDWLLTTIRSTSRTPSLNGRRCALPRQQSSFGRCRRYSGRDNVTEQIRRSADFVTDRRYALLILLVSAQRSSGQTLASVVFKKDNVRFKSSDDRRYGTELRRSARRRRCQNAVAQ